MKTFTFLIMLFAAVNCSAKTIYVDLEGGGDFEVIQDAIDYASYGDTVLVADGEYTGVGNYDLVLNGIGITVESENGPANCIIDPEDNGRGFYLLDEDPNSIVRGFTITNGYDGDSLGGGGIYIHNTDMLIENCVIQGNTGFLKGGGISIWVSAATVKDCVIESNSTTHASAMVYGGGMYLTNCNGLVVDNCQIIDNLSSGQGGGVYIQYGAVSFNDCVIRSNRADSTSFSSHGGGIFATEFTQLNITCSKLIDNYCTYYGAGLHLAYGDTNITNSLLEGNYTERTGGGIYNFGSMLDIVNSTLVKNHSQTRGGGCYLSANTSYSTVCNLLNNIFWQNTAVTDGPEFYIVGSGSGITTMNYSYNDLDQTAIYNNLGVLNDLGGNIYADPNFAAEGYDSGGNWVAGDYHLKSQVGRYDPVSTTWVTDTVDSPCIDAGDPADSVGNEPYPHGSRANMGFYGRSSEASQSPTCSAPIPADLTGDCWVDLADMVLFALSWLDCNIDPPQFCWQ